MKFQTLIKKFQDKSKHFVSGLLLFTIIQIPALPTIMPFKLTSEIKSVKAEGEVKSGSVIDEVKIVDEFFGTTNKAVSAPIVEKQIAFVSSRKAYPASLAVVEKHAESIKAAAKKKNVPEDVALGVALLENGGSETAKSPAGALGIYQLMPGTARNLGLTVNSKVDDRRSPTKSIEAGLTYLSTNYNRFGDWGLATWAYHAGEGNVAKALKLYAKANHGINLPGIGEWDAMKNFVIKYDISIHKLLSDPSVKSLTNKLNDDTAGYPYKVLATAELFKQAQSR